MSGPRLTLDDRENESMVRTHGQHVTALIPQLDGDLEPGKVDEERMRDLDATLEVDEKA